MPDMIQILLIVVWLSIAAGVLIAYRYTRLWGVAAAVFALVTAGLHYLVYPYVIAPGITGVVSLLLAYVGLRRTASK